MALKRRRSLPALLAMALIGTWMTPPSPAQTTVTPIQRRQIEDFAYFLRVYEARFGPMPPRLRQNMAATAADEIAAGRYQAFIAGLRQAIGVEPGFGQRPPDAPGSGPASPALGDGRASGSGPGGDGSLEAAVTGMRVFYLQRSPLGMSHASGYVHFCPNNSFHEGHEATLQNPQLATADANAGEWRIENGTNGAVVALYYRRGPRAGQRIEYRLQDMLEGRWTTTNWRYAVDRQALCGGGGTHRLPGARTTP